MLITILKLIRKVELKDGFFFYLLQRTKPIENEDLFMTMS